MHHSPSLVRARALGRRGHQVDHRAALRAWGVAVVALPFEKDMTEVRKQIERVLEAFGLTAEDESDGAS